MNIFYLHHDPREAARMHADQHVNKMIMESAQMLCTVCREYGGMVDVPYKSTHKNHPCTKWVAESRWNYHWLRSMVFWLHEEWRKRWNHTYDEYHKSYLVCRNLPVEPDFLPDVDCTPPPQAMDEKYRRDGDPVGAYRAYYLGEKRNLMGRPTTWKTGEPEWWK